MEQTGFLPAVLLCGFGHDARALRIREYLKAQGILVLDAADGDYGRSLGEVLGIPGFPKTQPAEAAADISGEMLVMYAMQGEPMQRFLRFFRDEGLAPVALKAVATPINLFWSPKKLFLELQREREWFEQQKSWAAGSCKNGG